MNVLDAVGHAPERDATTDRLALWRFFEATSGRSWKDSTGWGTSLPLGEWHGITVDSEDRVIEVELVDNNLKGGCHVLVCGEVDIRKASRPLGAFRGLVAKPDQHDVPLFLGETESRPHACVKFLVGIPDAWGHDI